MPLHNADIAAIFEEIADLLEIRGDNPFRIRAYRNAARSVGEFAPGLKSLIESGTELPKLPGIGADLTAKIHEIVATGHCTALDKLRKEMPSAITELLRIPGLGPKRVKRSTTNCGCRRSRLAAGGAHGADPRACRFRRETEQRILVGWKRTPSRAARQAGEWRRSMPKRSWIT